MYTTPVPPYQISKIYLTPVPLREKCGIFQNIFWIINHSLKLSKPFFQIQRYSKKYCRQICQEIMNDGIAVYFNVLSGKCRAMLLAFEVFVIQNLRT